MSADRVLLVEDDDQMASLISLLVETASPGTTVERCVDVADAESRFSPKRHCLVLCDWNLPGRPGIALLPTIRAAQPRVPVLMVTGRTDRASVVTARAQGVDGFIAKPFQVEQLVERLAQYLPVSKATEGGDPPGLLDALAALDDGALEAPMAARLGALATQPAGEDPPELDELAESWARQPVLAGRLLAMANSSAYNPQGRVCGSLREALQRLGWRTSLNVATALALRQGAEPDDARLTARLGAELDRAEKVAEAVSALAREARIDPAPLQTAALMHRLGELCVLLQIAVWQVRHGTEAAEADIDAALAKHARPFAHRLKARWGYPQTLRAMIAAIYGLPDGTARPELLILRLAGSQFEGGLSEEDTAKLRRLVFD
ncbi:response regulator [Pseudomarimonas salicorniae]|uniref:Response regulator n=1 Tax=Pseudomarimonas salicorniae TaxID=2933270 RepID=A0ABT0GEG9_9GAMM|nr:response regulator [Lysobacter sp. CAU 1642]MCK7592422.1 response regulator [Lysobacter sp. CAU 1642]